MIARSSRGGWAVLPYMVIAAVAVCALIALAPTTWAAPRGMLPHRVLATVPVGYRPYGVAVNPITHKVYVANSASNSVSVIDGLTNTEVAAIPVGPLPYYWLGVSAARNQVYVVNNAGGLTEGSLTVIDGATDAVVATVAGLGMYPEGIAVDEGRGRVYVEGMSRFTEIDAVTHAIVRSVAMPDRNHGLAIDPELDLLVSVYGPVMPAATFLRRLPDLATVDHGATWGGYPTIDLITHTAYYADLAGRQVLIQDLQNPASVAVLPVALSPFLAAMDPGRGCLYLSNPGYIDLITAVDTVGRRDLGTIRVGKQPSGIAVDPVTGHVFVANTGDGTVSVIQGERCDLVGTATITPAPGTATKTPRPTPTRPAPTASTVPSASPTGTPPPSATARSATPGPTAPPACVCRLTRQRVPAVVLNDALANPQRYLGWRQPLDPGKPPGPANPPRACLVLQNAGVDYHPLWNRPIWRVGCP